MTRAKIKRIVFYIPTFIEIIVGLVITMVICFALFGVITRTTANSIFEDGGLMIFLQRITEIIIGIEFVKLIFSHTMDATLEVIIMAIVRQIIIDHLPPLDTILFVAAIAILFIVRKYFFVKQLDRAEEDEFSRIKKMFIKNGDENKKQEDENVIDRQ